MFAGKDGWYDIYQDENGVFFKQKIGSGSGTGSDEEGNIVDLSDYYTKEQTVQIIDNKINESVAVQQGTYNLTLSPNVNKYYFSITSFIENAIMIQVNNNTSGVWELSFVGNYYDNSVITLPVTISFVINGIYYNYDLNFSALNRQIKTYIFSISNGDASTRRWIDITPATKEELSTIPKFSTLVVSDLPIENISETTVYLVPSGLDTEEYLYKEYIYVNSRWEMLGAQTSNINLENYYTKNEIDSRFLNIENSLGITETILDETLNYNIDEE